MSKYHNDKVVADGIRFDSKKERDFYCGLKMLQQSGEVEDIRCQVTYELQPKFKHNGETVRAIKYIADFVVTNSDGSVDVFDVKGFKTKEYLLKKKMLLYKYPYIRFKEV